MYPEVERTVSEWYADFFDVVHFITHFPDNDVYTSGILSDDIDVISVMTVESEEGVVILSEFFVVSG